MRCMCDVCVMRDKKVYQLVNFTVRNVCMCVCVCVQINEQVTIVLDWYTHAVKGKIFNPPPFKIPHVIEHLGKKVCVCVCVCVCVFVCDVCVCVCVCFCWILFMVIDLMHGITK